jgi:hypothetical protein
MRSFVVAWVLVGGLWAAGCSGASKGPETVVAAPATTQPAAPPPASAPSAAPRPAGPRAPNPCEIAGGKCISPMAAVVCKSNPQAACAASEICCAM